MTGRAILLSRHGFDLEVAPQAGGGVTRLNWHGHPLLRPALADVGTKPDPRDLSCFPMTPYVSRITNGDLVWGGVTAKIAPNMDGSSHPLHGIGWLRQWQIVAQTDASLRIQLTHKGDEDWPWAFDSTQDFVLTETGLQHRIAIKSQDARPFPTSLGPHPYFCAKDARIQFEADALWETSGEALPTHRATPPVVTALAAGCAAHTLDLDHCFEGWTGRARIDWPDYGVTIDAQCAVDDLQAPCTRLQLYTPQGTDFFCLEPVTARCVAFGEADPAQLGVVELVHQTLSITTTYTPHKTKA